MVIVAIIASLVTWLFMYIDARLFDTPRSKFTYFKNMVLVSCISVAIVYFMGGGLTVSKFQVGGGATALLNKSYINGIDQEIFTGSPNF